MGRPRKNRNPQLQSIAVQAGVIDPDSLKEAMVRHRRKTRLTQLYDAGKLPFHSYDGGTECSDCHATDQPAIAGVKALAPIDLIQMDDEPGMLLCRKCFCIRFYNRYQGNEHPGGNVHPDTPASELRYNGTDQM